VGVRDTDGLLHPERIEVRPAPPLKACRSMDAVAREYSEALHRDVTYVDIRPEEWERGLKEAGLPEHLSHHLVAMAELNRTGRYDRMADGVERVTGQPAMGVREFVSLHADAFGGRRS
jgi:hypothetical protein